jgi:hypothetical protein
MFILRSFLDQFYGVHRRLEICPAKQDKIQEVLEATSHLHGNNLDPFLSYLPSPSRYLQSLHTQ